MTVDELREVLDERFTRHEKHEDAQYGQIIERLDSINGKVAEHEREITAGKIRDAYWAGGVVAVLGLIKVLWK
jgi:hypothetical protein